MAKPAPHLKASGIFIILGLITIFFSILFVGGDRFFLTQKSNLKIKLDKVQGLAKGSVVSLAGINVGNIRNIEFSKDSNEIDVTISIDQSHMSRLTTNTTVSVKTQGALGDKYVYLEPHPGGQPLKENDFIQKKGEADLFDRLSKKGSGVDQTLEIMSEIRVLLKKLNSDDGVIQSIKDSSLTLNSTLSEFQKFAQSLNSEKNTQNIASSLKQVNKLLTKLNKTEGTLGALINDPSIHNRLLEILGSQKRSQFLKHQIRDVIKKQE